MARTLLAGEFDTATNTDVRADVDVKVEVENGSGTYKDLSALLGKRWTASLGYGEHVNNKVGSATITLIQQIGTASLAPLVESSALNVLDDNVTYSPLIDIGRGIRFSTATTAHGVAPVSGDYRPAFEGRITRHQLNDEGGVWAGPVVLECSDLGAWLMDLQIETPEKQYGDPDAPPNLEDVLQAVIDDNLPAGDPAVTVVKTSSSNFAVTDYVQGETKVMEALTTLVLDSTGEDIRYRFDASHVSTLQWFDPQRSRSSFDGTFPKESYILRTLDTAIDDVRNAGAMPFTDVASGVTGVVTAESLASIDKYRRRFFRLPGSDLLTTRGESQAVINRVVNDLEGPIAEAQAVVPFCWFVQLYDRYTFEANGRQYTDDQTFSVVGYQHSIESGRAITTLTLAGRVVGAYDEWLKRIRAGGAVLQTASIQRVSSTEATDGTARDFVITIGARVDTVHLHYRTVPIDVVGDPLDFSGNETVTEAVTTSILPRVAGSDEITFSIPHPELGYRVAARLIPYTTAIPDPIEGPSWPFTIDPEPPVGPVMDVVGTPGTTTFTITYTATGTLDYSVDGASYTSVPASPFVVSRNAAGGADKVLTFRCTRNEQSITSMITVPSQVATPGATPQVNNLRVTAIDNSSNEITLAWDDYNIPVGATFNLEWSLGGSYFGQNSIDTNINGITSPYTHNDTGSGGHGLDLVLGGTTENIYYVIRVDYAGNPIAYSDPYAYLTDHA